MAAFRFVRCLDNQCRFLQVYQPLAPVVGVAVGLTAGTVGLGVAGIGVAVVPVVGVGSAVGFVAGTVGIVGVPIVGVVFVPVAELVF